MGMFDDLIPAPKEGGGGSGGMFDDLIPKPDVTGGMVLRGIPVLGAYVPQAEAAVRAATHPLTGEGEPGATYAERYAKNLPLREADYAAQERAHPYISTGAQLFGGAAALAPLGATALGARALGAAGPLGQRIVAGGLSGAGISAADALARGEDPTTAAGVGGAVGSALPVLGSAVSRIGRTARSFVGAPNADELGTAVDAGYSALRGSGLEIKPQAMQSAINQIRIDQEIHPRSAPMVTGLLDDAANKGIMSPLTGAKAGVKFDDIDALRKELGGIARNYTNPTEQLAARNAMRGLDDYLAKISPADVLAGDAKQVATLASETRGNAAAEFRLRAMDAVRQRAEDQAGSAASGMNIENAYRQQLRAFIRPNNKGISPAKKEGFNEQEINRMRVATRGTSFPNMLRLVSNMLGGGHGLMAGAALATSYQTGDPRYAMAAGLGYGGRRLSNSMMQNRGEMLARMTAARSPLAAQMGTGGPAASALPTWLGPAQGGLLGMLPGMAEGGRPTGPTVVGEQGPEVFVPDRPGTIVPGPNGPMPSNAEIQRYLAATTQNYPKFGPGGIPINPAGVDAMLEHSPESQNIEDRRDERGGFACDGKGGVKHREGMQCPSALLFWVLWCCGSCRGSARAGGHTRLTSMPACFCSSCCYPASAGWHAFGFIIHDRLRAVHSRSGRHDPAGRAGRAGVAQFCHRPGRVDPAAPRGRRRCPPCSRKTVSAGLPSSSDSLPASSLCCCLPCSSNARPPPRFRLTASIPPSAKGCAKFLSAASMKDCKKRSRTCSTFGSAILKHNSRCAPRLA